VATSEKASNKYCTIVLLQGPRGAWTVAVRRRFQRVERPKPRKATSLQEIEQIARVHGLLCVVGVAPSPELMVTLARRERLTGLLVKNCVGSKLGRQGRPRAYSGALTLATEDGNVQIDYLDIVWLEKAKLSTGHSKRPRPPEAKSKRNRRHRLPRKR